MNYRCDYVSKPFSEQVDQIIVSSTDSDTNNETIDDKIKRRRGGKGKPRLDRNTRVRLILENLPNAALMDSKVAYNPGLYMNEIIRLFPSPNWRDIPTLIEELYDVGIVIHREGRKDERPPKYYYRTEKGASVLVDLQRIEKIHAELPF